MGNEKWYSINGTILFQDMLDYLDELACSIMEDVESKGWENKDEINKIVLDNFVKWQNSLIKTYEAEWR
jgi:hypothetical protein